MSHLPVTHQAYYQSIPLKSQTAHQHNQPSSILLPFPFPFRTNTQHPTNIFQVSSFKTGLIPRHMPTDRPPIYPDNPTISPSHHPTIPNPINPQTQTRTRTNSKAQAKTHTQAKNTPFFKRTPINANFMHKSPFLSHTQSRRTDTNKHGRLIRVNR